MAHVITGWPDETDTGHFQGCLPKLYPQSWTAKEQMTHQEPDESWSYCHNCQLQPHVTFATICTRKFYVIHPLFSFHQTQFRCRVLRDYIWLTETKLSEILPAKEFGKSSLQPSRPCRQEGGLEEGWASCCVSQPQDLSCEARMCTCFNNLRIWYVTSLGTDNSD